MAVEGQGLFSHILCHFHCRHAFSGGVVGGVLGDPREEADHRVSVPSLFLEGLGDGIRTEEVQETSGWSNTLWIG
jgi:hypothetical protein